MKQKSAAFQALCRRSNSKMIKPMVKMIIVNEDKRDDQNDDNRMIDKTLIEINSLGLLLSEKWSLSQTSSPASHWLSAPDHHYRMISITWLPFSQVILIHHHHLHHHPITIIVKVVIIVTFCSFNSSFISSNNSLWKLTCPSVHQHQHQHQPQHQHQHQHQHQFLKRAAWRKIKESITYQFGH